MRAIVARCALALLSLAIFYDCALAGWHLDAADSASFWQPLAIVLLRGVAALLAIVPSSPVVLAAGLTEGPLWGTVYVLLGAETGALIAFYIGRHFGRSFVERRGWMAPIAASRYGRWLLEGETSQQRLMATVFYCRLVPGLNLDGLSYVAGVTPISVWRFGLATFGGLFPYTIALVLIGRQLAEMHPTEALAVVILLLTAGALPWIWIRGSNFVRRRSSENPPGTASSQDRS
jgi:uncharacterized membrane protein YdjX (TVP38/TMEM64 family)